MTVEPASERARGDVPLAAHMVPPHPQDGALLRDLNGHEDGSGARPLAVSLAVVHSDTRSRTCLRVVPPDQPSTR